MVALTVSTPSARCARVVPHRDTAPSTSSRRRVGGRGRWEESPSRGVSIRRRGAVVVRASGDDAGGSQATTSAWEDDASASSSFGAGDAYVPPAPPRRETPLERAVKDPLAAAIMAPRVALGGLDLLSKGELFAVAAEEAGELSALLSDPRPIQDKAAEAFRRAETVVEMFEARGVVAEAPGRELVRPAIPADLYDKYLDPAAIEPAPATPSASANAYTAEPASYASAATTTREVEIPESEAFTAASTAASASVTYAFDDAEDAAVAAAAAAVARRRSATKTKTKTKTRAVRWIRKASWSPRVALTPWRRSKHPRRRARRRATRARRRRLTRRRRPRTPGARRRKRRASRRSS